MVVHVGTTWQIQLNDPFLAAVWAFPAITVATCFVINLLLLLFFILLFIFCFVKLIDINFVCLHINR